MKVLIIFFICMAVVICLSLTRAAGMADRRLEELKVRSADREAGGMNGN